MVNHSEKLAEYQSVEAKVVNNFSFLAKIFGSDFSIFVSEDLKFTFLKNSERFFFFTTNEYEDN